MFESCSTSHSQRDEEEEGKKEKNVERLLEKHVIEKKKQK